jgi:DNA polymerase-3 subunit delta
MSPPELPMPVETDAFFARLEKGDLPAVVGIGGAERIYLDDALALLRSRSLDGGMADFNHDRLSAREHGASEAVSRARTLPVMARRRLVEVRDADVWKERDADALAAYLDDPAPETVLVLTFGELDLRDKLPKLLDKRAVLARFDHPKERDMPEHVRRRAARHGLRVDGDAAEALAATVGADLTLLERALEKLALACDGEVSVAAVSTHVADTHLEDAFGLARAVARGDRAEAVRTLGELQAAREAPLALVGLLAWQLRQIARARALIDEGRAGEIGPSMRLFGDRLQTVVQAARAADGVGHAARLARLADADRLLKGSRQPEWLVMARLVLDLCPPKPASAAGTARSRTR